jgi:ribonucleoside-triphosphate reductase
MQRVIKRDGREVESDKTKIIKSIDKAFAALGKEDEGGVAEKIADAIEAMDKVLDVDEIQNLIEAKLMASKHKDVAKTYINYRYLHKMARGQYNELMTAVAEKLTAKNVQNQNANVDEASFGGRVGEASSVVTKQYALEYLVSPMAKANHMNNEIYIHDLDAYATGSHNCMSIPFDDLLKNGFNTRQTDVRPAQSINTAFQLIAVIFQLQSLQQFGGVSATHLDWTMVPYVRKSFYKHYKNICDVIPGVSDNLVLENPEDVSIDDAVYRGRNWCNFVKRYVTSKALKATKKELKQAVEGMYHNLNTLQSRSGNQLPFTSINYGTCTKPEGRMVIEALLNGSIKGIGQLHKTSIFPCGIFQCMTGVNRKPGDPNYDLYRLALKSTSKRLYPNYCNVDWSGNAGYDINDPRTYFSTMGCRTANGWDVNGFGQLKDGRGNICPVTIIMPTLAMQAKERYNRIQAGEEAEPVGAEGFGPEDYFLMLLDKKISEAKDMLIERFDWIAAQSAASAKFMYENHVMAGYIPEEGIRSALRHGTLAIGQLGLAETLQILIGTDHTTKEGMDLAKHIEQLFKTRCAEFKKEYSLNFGVYYTPAENLCKTAMIKFKNTYGEIPNVSDKEYFTNSIHVPVYHQVDAFKKIDIESQLTGYSSAGCITYVELDGDCLHNVDAIEEIVNYAMDHDIPYFAINVPNDTCLDCGFTGEFNDSCPACCSTNIQQLRRVTGYLTGNYKTAFNSGKIAETEDRVKHTGVSIV